METNMNSRLELIYIKSDKLKKLDNNPRVQIDDGATKKLRALIREHGFQNPLQVWRENGKYTILCGNHRYGAGMLEGMREFPCIEYKGTKQEAIARAISDNKSNEWTDWAGDELAMLLRELETADFSIPEFTGFDQGEIEALLGDLEVEGLTDADDVPALPEGEPVTQLGDLWTLGRHRLICGDATDKETVTQLMNGAKADMVFTDPPYGMNLETDFSKRDRGKGLMGKRQFEDNAKLQRHNYSKIIGDDKDYDPTHLFEMFPKVREMFLWGADYYAERIPEKNKGSWIVWDKRAGIEDVEFNLREFETCWSKKKHARRLARFQWFGLMGLGKEDTKSRIHPTQKPVSLIVWFFKQWGKKDGKVVDLFLGSGSTLIACEQTDRSCYGTELDPKYCDVILKRWANFTGEDPVREDGAKWSELYGKAA
jgi:DNA modification methylase